MTDNKALLSESDCTRALHNYVQTDDFHLISYTLQPLSQGKEGLLGEHYTLRVRFQLGEEVREASFFMKTLQGNSKAFYEISKLLNVYEKEEWVYTKFCNELKEFGFGVDFAPKAFLCQSNFLILEDLKASGYESHSKVEALDMEHCKAALKTLSAYHAAGIFYEKKKSEEFGKDYCLKEKYPKLFEEKMFSNEENPVSKWFKHSIEGIFCLVDEIPENGISAKDFKERIQEVLDAALSEQESSQPVFNTLLHGDVWSNNFLFKYNEGSTIDCKLVDYQLFRYGPPSLDVGLFLMENTRKDFRNENYEILLNYYFNSLSRCLETEDIKLEELLPKEEFFAVCEELKPVSLLQAMVDKCITFSFDDMTIENIRNDEELEKYVYDDRSKHILNSYKNNKIFRKVIDDDLIELRSLLFS